MDDSIINNFAQKINEKEKKSNKVTALSSSVTDTQYPSAKIVYDSLNDLHTSDIKIGSEPLTNIWTGTTITEQAALNTLLNNHIGEIDARLQKEEIVYGSIYNTDSSRVYISGTYNKVCESVNSQHPLLNKMILFKLPNDLNLSSTKSIRIKVIYYLNSYSSSTSYYELPVKYNNVAIKENTFISNTIILLKLNSSNNGFDVVGVFSPNSTGSYTDLTDKPTIPSKTSDLTNDSGFLTSHQSLANYVQKSQTNGLLKNDGTVDTTAYSTFDGNYNNLTNKPSIPVNTSELNNDSGFITNSSVPSASSTTPSADTINGSYGSGTSYARSNHTHPKSSLYAEASHTHSQYLTSHQDITGKEDKSNKITSLNGTLTESDTHYPSSLLVLNHLDTKEDTSNKVTSMTAISTDDEYPSAKCVYDKIEERIDDVFGYIPQNLGAMAYEDNVDGYVGAVALSNDYEDLDNKPTIPSNTSDLTNDSGFITNSSVPSASSTTPSADTTSGSAGTGTTWARSDHTHPKSSLYAEASHTHSDTDITTLGFYTNLPQANFAGPSQQQVNSAINSAMGSKEDNANKVTSLSSSSTDTQYPSAKCVHDELESLFENTIDELIEYGESL